MGKNATMSEIHPDTIIKTHNGEEIPQEDLSIGLKADLDKAWITMHYIFQEFEPPLKYTIIGDSVHPLSSNDIEDLIENRTEFYIGFMSPKLVKEVSKELDKLKHRDLTKLYKQYNDIFDEYNKKYLSKLKEAYSTAAANDNALYICASI